MQTTFKLYSNEIVYSVFIEGNKFLQFFTHFAVIFPFSVTMGAATEYWVPINKAPPKKK